MYLRETKRRRRYVVAHNPDEVKRQRAHRQRLLTELEAELATMKPRADGKHTKRACELVTSARFGRFLRQTSTGKLCIDRAAVADAARYDGKWVVTSNDDTLNAEDLALGYKQLLRVERCWRQLKSGLHMRPVHHYKPWRIHAHVSIAVLALLLERIVEIRTGDTWRNVRARLEAIKVVEYDREGQRIRQTTEVRKEALELLKRLGVAVPSKIHSIVPVPAPATDGDDLPGGEDSGPVDPAIA